MLTKLLHESVEPGSLGAVALEVLFRRKQRRIDELHQRVELMRLELHRRGREKEQRTFGEVRRCGEPANQIVELGRLHSVTGSSQSGVVGFIDDHHVPLDLNDKVRPLLGRHPVGRYQHAVEL